jgi:hypothetical protein
VQAIVFNRRQSRSHPSKPLLAPGVRANVVPDVSGRKISIHAGSFRTELILVGQLGELSLFGLHTQKVNEAKINAK